MRAHAAALFIFAAGSAVVAQTPPPMAAAPEARASMKDAALDELLSERESRAAHEKAVHNARKAGVGEQAILEARFLYHVDQREDQAIAAMLPEFLARRDNFRPEDSAIFSVREDWLAVIEYVTAIDALGKGDKDGFKRHITEAFWLGPRQAAAFAPHIERLRLEEHMRSVKIDFSATLTSLSSGDAIVLGDLMKGNKALLLHFWSPRSPECEASMQDFAASAASLIPNGIAVASVLPGGDAALAADARPMIPANAGKPCGAWLIDLEGKSLGRDLRIQNLPTMVLVSQDGSILFNGAPTDDDFWSALNQIDARIVRPAAAKDMED